MEKVPNGGIIEANINYGLQGQFKVDLYDKNNNLIEQLKTL